MKKHSAEIARYAVNGLVATAVHFGVLTANINWFAFESAGLANFVAAIFGVTASFLGSRYFVFNKIAEGIFIQGVKFAGLYGLIAILHGFFLWIWTDLNQLDYRTGFFLATAIQVSGSYFGNKFLVFR